MKRLLVLLLTVGALFSCGKAPIESFTIKKGVNVAHWLSQSRARGEIRKAYFTPEDVAQIKEWGFDHIRLPIDEEQMFHLDGSKDEEAFALLHTALDACMKNNLRVVVDLHILRTHSFGSKVNPLFTERSAQEAFFECWRKLSDELKDYPVSMVAYELMNEPVAEEHEIWNKLVNECYQEVRKLEKDRVIVIGSNDKQSFDTVEALRLPEGDPNVMLSFHYYHPMELTHYQAAWTEFRDLEAEIHYPGAVVENGNVYNKERFAKEFGRSVAVAKKLGIPVYCGEYGVLAVNGHDEPRYNWLADVNEVFDDLGIARAVWCWREGDQGFGILSPGGKVDQKMIDILTR